MCVRPFALSLFAFVCRVTQSNYLVGLLINESHAPRLREEAFSGAQLSLVYAWLHNTSGQPLCVGEGERGAWPSGLYYSLRAWPVQNPTAIGWIRSFLIDQSIIG